jgi:predicted HTH transcriptional regulator
LFETLDQIFRQLASGEDSRVEFKEIAFKERGVRSPNAEDLSGEMVAFANADGGAVFLGVDDDGVVRGIPADDQPPDRARLLRIARGRRAQDPGGRGRVQRAATCL